MMIKVINKLVATHKNVGYFPNDITQSPRPRRSYRWLQKGVFGDGATWEHSSDRPADQRVDATSVGRTELVVLHTCR